MKRKVKIAVNECHIKKGLKESMKSCPIALAMKDEGFLFQGAYSGVDNRVVRFRDHVNIKDFYYKSSDLPLKAQEFISDFDQNKPVKPFKFILEVEE
jgi:hypothetical protein